MRVFGTRALVPFVATVAMLTVGAAGCRGANERSAGVDGASTAAPAVASRALLIGEADGADEYVFDEIHDVAIGSDGTLLVADRSATIRVFDSAGAFLRTIGRRGNGPGEYQQPFIVASHTDGGLQVYDARLRRLSTLDASGRHLASVPVAAAGTPVGAGGGVLWLENLAVARDGSSSASYAAIDLASGATLHTFAVELPPATVTERAGTTSFVLPDPWRRPIARACDATLCLLLPPSDTLWRVNAQGDRAVAGTLPEAGRAGPQHRPVLVADEQGRPWTILPAAGMVAELVRLDRDVTATTLVLPAHLRPYVVRGERVAGVETDAVGVEFVALYRIAQ